MYDCLKDKKVDDAILNKESISYLEWDKIKEYLESEEASKNDAIDVIDMMVQMQDVNEPLVDFADANDIRLGE